MNQVNKPKQNPLNPSILSIFTSQPILSLKLKSLNNKTKMKKIQKMQSKRTSSRNIISCKMTMKKRKRKRRRRRDMDTRL